MLRPMMRRIGILGLAVIATILLVPHVASAATACSSTFGDYQQRGWIWMYLAAFGFGFQTSLTPCVYPMIPITLGIFGARGKNVTRARALALATAYVVGMGLTYATLGVIIALVGGQFGTLLSNPYVVVPIVLVFAALAVSMFGVFEMNLPAAWQARLSQVGGSGFKGAFMMGMVGGLVAAPCTGPFLLGLLTYVATTRSVIGGGSLLFVYALGMGVLFWVLAAFAMSLPKSGRWMEWVKSGGGILLLIGGIYFLRPFLGFMREGSPELWFLLVSIGLVVVGFALGAVHKSFHGDLGEKLRKGVGVLLVLTGVFGIWSYSLAPKHQVPWVWNDEKAAFDRARTEKKGVMIDFGATWCIPCGKIERTFGDTDVYNAIMKDFVPLKFDVTKDTAENSERKERYDAGTLPSVVFVGTDGTLLGKINKEVEPDEALQTIAPAAFGLRHPEKLATTACK
jgi:thiol:disulfide interchange protein DsbD